MAESLFRQTQKRRLELPKETPGRKKRKSNETPSEDDSDADRPTSPTNRCPICLLVLNNRSYTDTCLHEFCFLCIKQWSQIKHECPLCKQTFRMIMHSVRALDDYKEYLLPPLEPPTSPGLFGFTGSSNGSAPGSGGETGRVSLQIENASNLNLRFSLAMVGMPSERLFGALPTRRRRPRQQYSLAADRAMVYIRNLWVRVNQQLGYRLSSPGFYRTNEAMTHRLCVWLHREVRVLVTLDGVPDRRSLLSSTEPYASSQSVEILGSDRDPAREEEYRNYIVNRFMDSIRQYPIRHPQMINLAKYYFGQYGHHFIHEFYAFAISTYDLIGYDREAQYVSHNMVQFYVDLTSPGGPSTSSAPDENPNFAEPRRDIEILDEVVTDVLDDSQIMYDGMLERRRTQATPPVSLSTNEEPRIRRRREAGGGDNGDSSDDVICISPPPIDVIELSTDDEADGATRTAQRRQGRSTVATTSFINASDMGCPSFRSFPSSLQIESNVQSNSAFTDDDDAAIEFDDASIDNDSIDEDYVPPGTHAARSNPRRRRPRRPDPTLNDPFPRDFSDSSLEVVTKEASSAKTKGSKKKHSSKATSSKSSSSKPSSSKESPSKSSTSKGAKASTSKGSSSKALTLKDTKASTSKDSKASTSKESKSSTSKASTSKGSSSKASTSKDSKPSTSKDSSSKSSTSKAVSKNSSKASQSKDLSSKIASKDSSSKVPSLKNSSKTSSSIGISGKHTSTKVSESRRKKPTNKRDVTADPTTILAAGFPSLQGASRRKAAVLSDADSSDDARKASSRERREQLAVPQRKSRRGGTGATNPTAGPPSSKACWPVEDSSFGHNAGHNNCAPKLRHRECSSSEPSSDRGSSRDATIFSSTNRGNEKKSNASQRWSILKSNKNHVTSSDSEEDFNEPTEDQRNSLTKGGNEKKYNANQVGRSVLKSKIYNQITSSDSEEDSNRPTEETRNSNGPTDGCSKRKNSQTSSTSGNSEFQTRRFSDQELQRPTRKCKNTTKHFFRCYDSDDISSGTENDSSFSSRIHEKANATCSRKASDVRDDNVEKGENFSKGPKQTVFRRHRASFILSSESESEAKINEDRNDSNESPTRSNKGIARIDEENSGTKETTKLSEESDYKLNKNNFSSNQQDYSNSNGLSRSNDNKIKRVRRRRKRIKRKHQLSESENDEARLVKDVNNSRKNDGNVKKNQMSLKRFLLSETSSDETEDKEKNNIDKKNCDLKKPDNEDSESENDRSNGGNAGRAVGSSENKHIAKEKGRQNQSNENYRKGQSSGETKCKSVGDVDDDSNLGATIFFENSGEIPEAKNAREKNCNKIENGDSFKEKIQSSPGEIDVGIDENDVTHDQHIVNADKHIMNIKEPVAHIDITNIKVATSVDERTRNETEKNGDTEILNVSDESSSNCYLQDSSRNSNCSERAFGSKRTSLGDRLLSLRDNLRGKDAKGLYTYFISKSVDNTLEGEKNETREPFALKIFETLPGIESLASFLRENADEFDQSSAKTYKETSNTISSTQPTCSKYLESSSLEKLAGNDTLRNRISANNDIDTLRTLTGGLTNVNTFRRLKKEIADIDSQRARNRVLAGIATLRALIKEIDFCVAANDCSSSGSSCRRDEAEKAPTRLSQARKQSFEENENEEYIRNLNLIQEDSEPKMDEVILSSNQFQFDKLTPSTSNEFNDDLVVIPDDDVIATDDDVIPVEDSNFANRRKPAEVLVLSSDDEVKQPKINLVSSRQCNYHHKKFSQARKLNPVVHDIDSDDDEVENIDVVGEVKQALPNVTRHNDVQPVAPFNTIFRPFLNENIRHTHTEFSTKAVSTSQPASENDDTNKNKNDEIIEVDTLETLNSKDVEDTLNNSREYKKPQDTTAPKKLFPSISNEVECYKQTYLIENYTHEKKINDLDDIYVDSKDPIFSGLHTSVVEDAPTCSRYLLENQIIGERCGSTFDNIRSDQKDSEMSPKNYDSQKSYGLNKNDSGYSIECHSEKHSPDDTNIIVDDNDDIPLATKEKIVISIDTLEDDEGIICVDNPEDNVNVSKCGRDTGNQNVRTVVEETDDFINVTDVDVPHSIHYQKNVDVVEKSRRETLPQPSSPTIDLEEDVSDDAAARRSHKVAATKKYVQKILKFNQLWKGHCEKSVNRVVDFASGDFVSPRREKSSVDERSQRAMHENTSLENQMAVRSYAEACERAARDNSSLQNATAYDASNTFDNSSLQNAAAYDAFDRSAHYADSSSSWPINEHSSPNYTIYENRTKQVVATLCGPHRTANVPEQTGGRIMEITTKETYDVVKIRHEKSEPRKRCTGETDRLREPNDRQSFLDSLVNSSLVDTSHVDASLVSRQDLSARQHNRYTSLGEDNSRDHRESISRCSDLIGNHPRSLLSNPPNYFQASHSSNSIKQSDTGLMKQFKHNTERRRVSCTKTQVSQTPSDRTMSATYATAPVAMETYRQKNESYPEYGSYYTPMDPRYLTYFAGYTSALGDTHNETKEKSPRTSVVKCESDSCSDVNVEDDDDRQNSRDEPNSRHLRVDSSNEDNGDIYRNPESKQIRNTSRHGNRSRDSSENSQTHYTGNPRKHSGYLDNEMRTSLHHDVFSTSHFSRSNISKQSGYYGNRSKQSGLHDNASESDSRSKSKESSLCRSISSNQSKRSKHSRSSKSSHKSKSRSRSKSRHKSKHSHRSKSQSRSQSSHKSKSRCSSSKLKHFDRVHSDVERESHRHKHKKNYSSDTESHTFSDDLKKSLSDAESDTFSNGLKRLSSDVDSDPTSYKHARKCSRSDAKCDSPSRKCSRKKRHKSDKEYESVSHLASRKSKKKSKRSHQSSSEE